MEERILTADIIENFRKNLELQEKSTSTIEKYIRDVKAFSVYAENAAITKEKVIAYNIWGIITPCGALIQCLQASTVYFHF